MTLKKTFMMALLSSAVFAAAPDLLARGSNGSKNLRAIEEKLRVEEEEGRKWAEQRPKEVAIRAPKLFQMIGDLNSSAADIQREVFDGFSRTRSDDIKGISPAHLEFLEAARNEVVRPGRADGPLTPMEMKRVILAMNIKAEKPDNSGEYFQNVFIPSFMITVFGVSVFSIARIVRKNNEYDAHVRSLQRGPSIS